MASQENFCKLYQAKYLIPFLHSLITFLRLVTFQIFGKLHTFQQFTKEVVEKNIKSSYRPISILPTLSKVCEAIVHNRLLSHCQDFNIKSERQAAYLKGDSTISQLVYIVHLIRSSLGSSKIVQGAFLDISAAFDKVWHNGLIAKLAQIGIHVNLLDFFKSYLKNRKQCVIVDGVKSNFLDVKAGVPQGSRLGPLLFIIYINDIINDIQSDIMIFADDTTLHAIVDDPKIIASQLNSRAGLKIKKVGKSLNLKWIILMFTNKTVSVSLEMCLKHHWKMPK